MAWAAALQPPVAMVTAAAATIRVLVLMAYFRR
jgi:hypothetical protein